MTRRKDAEVGREGFFLPRLHLLFGFLVVDSDPHHPHRHYQESSKQPQPRTHSRKPHHQGKRAAGAALANGRRKGKTKHGAALWRRERKDSKAKQGKRKGQQQRRKRTATGGERRKKYNFAETLVGWGEGGVP